MDSYFIHCHIPHEKILFIVLKHLQTAHSRWNHEKPGQNWKNENHPIDVVIIIYQEMDLLHSFVKGQRAISYTCFSGAASFVSLKSRNNNLIRNWFWSVWFNFFEMESVPGGMSNNLMYYICILNMLKYI